MAGRQRQGGFTLLEVMVALMLIGIGFTLSLSAMSGSLKLTRQASEHENAMLLAKARLDEVSQYPDYKFVDDVAAEIYGGTEYSYKIEFRPVPLLDERMAERVKLPFRLEELSINVYWGKDGRHSYSLTTFKMTPIDPAKDAAAKPGDKPAAAGAANTPGGSGTPATGSGSSGVGSPTGGSTPTKVGL